MNLRELFVSLGLEWDAAGFASAITAQKLLEKGAEMLVAAFAAVPNAVADALHATTEYGSQINDTSLRTGIAVDRLQELQYAFGLSGVSGEAMTGAVVRLGHTMGQALGGSKEAAKGFADLGVKVSGADGKIRNADETMLDLIDRLGEIENPTERSAKGVAIFGRAYTELAPVFAAGGDALRDQIELFRRLDLGMTKAQVEGADGFGDSLDTLSRIALAFKTDIGSVLIDGLQPFVDATIEWVAENRQLIKSGLQQFGRMLIGLFKGLVVAGKALLSVIQFIGKHWRLFATFAAGVLGVALYGIVSAFGAIALEAVIAGAASVAAGISAAAAWLAAAAPVIILVALFALFLLVIEDVWVAMQGGDSVIGSLGKKWSDFLDTWLADDTGDGWLTTALKAVIWLLSDITKRFPEAIAEWKTMIVDFFLKTVPRIIGEMSMKLPPWLRLSAGVVAAPGLNALDQGTQALFGGGAAGPSDAAGLMAPKVASPTFNAGGFTVVAQPGQDTAAIGDAVETKINDWWTAEKSGAAAGVGGW